MSLLQASQNAHLYPRTHTHTHTLCIHGIGNYSRLIRAVYIVCVPVILCACD